MTIHHHSHFLLFRLFTTCSTRHISMYIVLLALNVACAFTAPAPEPYVSTSSFDSSSRGIQYSSANARILGQINQHNEDGSYTFGYESEDGSFRIENRDMDGFVSGKYGYVDPNGKLQEFEYVAGSMNGQAIGYQARGSALPETNRAQEFPVMYPATSSSVDQKYQDYEYSSVDDDRDGFPDNIFHGSFGTRNTVPNVVRLTGNTAQTFIETPSNNVRLTSSVHTTPNVVPVVNTVQVSQQKPSVIRVTSPIQASFERQPQTVPVVNRVQVSQQKPSVVRLTSPVQASFEKPTQTVPVANSVQVSQQNPSLVRLTSAAQSSFQNPLNAVRFVNPAQVSSQQQIGHFSTSIRKNVIQPTRISGGRYQVATQNVQRQPQFSQVEQSVYQSPYYSNYGGQRFVSRNPVYSSGRLDSFLGGRFVVGGNHKLNTLVAPSTQQQAVFIDNDDFDDLNDFDDDFDDDDSFAVGRSLFL